MPLEQDLQACTAAMDKLTARIDKFLEATSGSAPVEAAGEKKAGPGRPKKDAPVSKYTPEQVSEMATKVKDEKGAAAAKELIAATGSANLAELKTKPEKFDEFVAACEAAIADDL